MKTIMLIPKHACKYEYEQMNEKDVNYYAAVVTWHIHFSVTPTLSALY